MIYVHVPFCRSFCTYCDFYSETVCRGNDAGRQASYTTALLKEIKERCPEIRETIGINTLYIGGGTPSVLSPSFFHVLTEALGCGPYREFTVEVNPEDIVEKGEPYIRELLDAGVNRISIGIQSLDDGILRWMNRRHDSARAAKAFGLIREAGCRNISADVIFGLSHMTEEMLSRTLEGMVSWKPEHVSAYQLSVEEGSSLAGMVADGRYVEATDEQCRAQYELICDRLAAAGYVHYEISNWALPGFEAVHNSAYWARKPYVGLGPGAHSLTNGRRSWNAQRLDWMEGGRDFGFETLTREEILEETVMLGLRTAKGLPAEICGYGCGRGNERESGLPEKIAELLARGDLVRSGDNIRIPESRFFVSDGIIADLMS